MSSNRKKAPAKKQVKKTYWNGGVPSMGPVERGYGCEEDYDGSEPNNHHCHDGGPVRAPNAGFVKCRGCSPCCGANQCCSGHVGSYDRNIVMDPTCSSCSQPANSCYACGCFPPAIPPPSIPYPYPSLGPNYYPYDVWGGGYFSGGYGQGQPGYGGMCPRRI